MTQASVPPDGKAGPRLGAGHLLVLPACLVFGGFVLWPMLLTIRDSFYSFSLVGSVQRFVGGANYAAMLQDPVFWLALRNNVFILVGSVVIQVGLGTLIVAGYAVPIYTVLVPLYRMLDAAGMLNSFAGLILPYVAFGIPFSIILLYAYLSEFPTELEEAARLDGCNRWQILRHVVAPLSLPGIASVAIFQGVFTWNEFLLALLIISNDSLKTLPVGLVAFRGEYANDWGAILASVTVATVPLLLLYILLQRHFVRSLAGLGK